MIRKQKGWIYAYITALLWAMNAIYFKVMSSYIENVNGLTTVLLSMLAGSFFLLILAGPGRLSLETLKSKNTWSFGTFQIISSLFIFATYGTGLSVIDGTLLFRMTIIISIVFVFISTGKIIIKSKLAILLLLLGFSIVIYEIPNEFKFEALFWLIITSFIMVLRVTIGEKHKESNLATGDFRTEMRVTGYILAITSSIYALVIFIAMKLNIANNINNLIPIGKEFFALIPLVLSIFAGATLMAAMKYTELISSKHIGTTGLFTVLAFVPALTVPTLYGLSMFTSIPFPGISINEIIGGVLIITGAVVMVKASANKKHPPKLSKKAKKELSILRDCIKTTQITFNNDKLKVSKALGVSTKAIDKILNSEDAVSKTMKDKIIFNHADNVVGIDHLTGAVNKLSFNMSLEKLNEVDQAIIMFIDLDKFKPINDTYGHAIGDTVLKGVAQRLISEYIFPDIVARIGGDEYCLIIYSENAKYIKKQEQKVKKLVSESFLVEQEGKDIEITVGCSIGSAHYPSEGQNGQQLQNIADKRMYEDKKPKGDIR